MSKIVELGCACATDLAGQIGGDIKPIDLMSPLNALVVKGILRHKIEANDSREYCEQQTVYELAR